MQRGNIEFNHNYKLLMKIFFFQHNVFNLKSIKMRVCHRIKK